MGPFIFILMGRRSNQEANRLQDQSPDFDKHRTRFRVRYAETDQMGVVYYANYLIWMEIGRVELVRARGFDYKEVEQTEGLFLSVLDANCHYLHPARYDQEIIVQTEVVKSSSRTIEFAYHIRSADPDRLLARGSTRHIWLNREWRPVRLPDQYREVLRIG
jgi:acyl-CoA thioester hydrolase